MGGRNSIVTHVGAQKQWSAGWVFLPGNPDEGKAGELEVPIVLPMFHQIKRGQANIERNAVLKSISSEGVRQHKTNSRDSRLGLD